jgi:tetratricopeptide (TPR) repeat protein
VSSFKHPSVLLGTFLLAASPYAMATIDVLSLWNYDDPAASELRFRELIKSASADDAAILETQIARTFGLRRRFDEARALLSRLEPRLPTLSSEARVRYHLEYGRTLVSPVHNNSEKTPEAQAAARSAYLTAYDIARQSKLDYLAIDALHMLPLVDTDNESSMKWIKLALDTAVQSAQPESKKWESMLRHNHGYYLHTHRRYEEALAVFQANIPITEAGGNATKLRIAHWMVGWTLRSLGRLDEALSIQLRLEQENAQGSTPDQYVFEELTHLYKAKGDVIKAKRYAELHEQQKAAEANERPGG